MAEYVSAVDYFIYPADANDNRYFDIDQNSGQIRVGSVDIPSPTPSDQIAITTDDAATTADPTLDYEGKNSFTLLVTGQDRGDSSKKTTAMVTVNLTNLNEAPYFDKETRERVAGDISYAENRRTAVAALAAIEPDGGALRWELTGDNASTFRIDDIADPSDSTRDRVELAFKSQPNYEPDPKTYNVTVRATEEMDSVGGGPAKATEIDVTVVLEDVEETGHGGGEVAPTRGGYRASCYT